MPNAKRFADKKAAFAASAEASRIEREASRIEHGKSIALADCPLRTRLGEVLREKAAACREMIDVVNSATVKNPLLILSNHESKMAEVIRWNLLCRIADELDPQGEEMEKLTPKQREFLAANPRVDLPDYIAKLRNRVVSSVGRQRTARLSDQLEIEALAELTDSFAGLSRMGEVAARREYLANKGQTSDV